MKHLRDADFLMLMFPTVRLTGIRFVTFLFPEIVFKRFVVINKYQNQSLVHQYDIEYQIYLATSE